ETVAAPSGLTIEGSILGTVGYMSPEQAAGRAVDFRSDQFALGLVAYEMTTGRRAFERPSAVETLAAIIREDPTPIAALRRDVPDAFQRLITRCLGKRPDDRFASTRDLAEALQSISPPDASQVSHDSRTVSAAFPAAAQATATLSRRNIVIALAVVAVIASG